MIFNMINTINEPVAIDIASSVFSGDEKLYIKDPNNDNIANSDNNRKKLNPFLV